MSDDEFSRLFPALAAAAAKADPSSPPQGTPYQVPDNPNRGAFNRLSPLIVVSWRERAELPNRKGEP